MGTVTPAFILLLLILASAILIVREEHVVVPIIVAMCFLPGDISVKLGTLDFQAIRIMALVATVRIYLSQDIPHIELNIIDKLFIAYNVLLSVVYIFASHEIFEAILFRGGKLIDSIILYLVFRHVVQSKESIKIISKVFCICIIILLPFAIFEFFSATNLFAILGRNRISIRADEIRAGTTFSHPILFGSFAAAIFPVLWSDFITNRGIIRIIALLSCVFCVYASSSSGPIIALAAAIFFIAFFKWKNHSALLARVMLISAIFIHFVREKPIWQFIFVRVSIKASSTGFHRYLLVDAAVKEFWNWWILGYGDIGPQWHTKYWPWTHATFTDMTNHYLLLGVRGGFFTMVLFIILCYKSIISLGSFSISQIDKDDQWLWWGFTVMMIVHCVSFLAVAYFGQITMLLFLTFAVAAFALDGMDNKNGKIRHRPNQTFSSA